MDCELVNFSTRDGLTLYGLLFSPKVRSNKAIIHLHGILGSFYRGGPKLAEAYTKNGYNLLCIEQRGSYSVFAPKRRNGKRLLAGGALERFEDCAKDIDGAVRLCRSMGMDRIYLEGTSTGATKAAYYQYKTQDKRIRAVILISPMDDYNSYRKELGSKFDSVIRNAKAMSKDPVALMRHKYGYMGARRFLSFADTKNVEARLFDYERKELSELRSIRVPVLAVFGSREEHALMPIKEYPRIISENVSNRNSEQEIVPYANHSFIGKEDKLAGVVVRWLSRFR